MESGFIMWGIPIKPEEKKRVEKIKKKYKFSSYRAMLMKLLDFAEEGGLEAPVFLSGDKSTSLDGKVIGFECPFLGKKG